MCTVCQYLELLDKKKKNALAVNTCTKVPPVMDRTNPVAVATIPDKAAEIEQETLYAFQTSRQHLLLSSLRKVGLSFWAPSFWSRSVERSLPLLGRTRSLYQLCLLRFMLTKFGYKRNQVFF